MSKQFGLDNLTIYRQPGFSVSRNDKGGWTGRGTYEMTQKAWESPTVRARFARLAPIENIDPEVESFLRFLRVDTVDVISDVGNTVTLDVTYTSGQTFQFDPTTGEPLEDAAFSTRLEIRERQDSILTAPKFLELTQDEQDALQLLLNGSLVYVKDVFATPPAEPALFWVRQQNLSAYLPALISDDAKEFAALIARGLKERTVYSVNWVYTTQGINRISANVLQNLNNAKNPPGNPPTPSGRDWKFIGATQETRGALISTTLQYELSEPGGWPEILE
jgi:hypothetical protein